MVVITRKGRETFERIKFNKGLPQGDPLCPKLFTECLNPVAWTISAAEGYRMSKLINSKVTGLLHIDHLKIFAASESKLERVTEDGQVINEGCGASVEPKEVCSDPCEKIGTSEWCLTGKR